MAELEKLGPKYRIALQIARDERWEVCSLPIQFLTFAGVVLSGILNDLSLLLESIHSQLKK